MALSDGDARLHRCIRDLAALTALPSMCVGRSSSEVLEIVLDALPTALSCDLVLLRFPDAIAKERAVLAKKRLDEAELAELLRAVEGLGENGTLFLPSTGRLHAWQVELPIGREQGCLLAARKSPLDQETDRVLIRSAANLVGTSLATAKALESAKRKDEFLAMLGHELRNPLAPILAAADLLALKQLPEVEKERTIIERQTRNLIRLVDDLLDISRAVSGKIVLQKQRLELFEVVLVALELCRGIVNGRRHQLEVLVPNTGLLLDADPARLAQALGNILTNAAKYTNAGGRISVRAERVACKVEIKVADNGMGIEPELLDSIFEPFFQENQAIDRAHGGLGLGLAIVRSLIELHGGDVRAFSEGRSRGTEVTVTLPLAEVIPEPAVATVLDRAASSSQRKGLRILVVDDNTDAAELVVAYLEHRGNTICRAHDGAVALSEALRFLPDVVVLDIGLPVMNGYEVARRIRESDAGMQMRLIALTGYGQETDRLRALEASFDAHLVKPVSMQRLEETIQALAKR